MDMNEDARRFRNMIGWGAVGFLIGGWVGTAIAVVIYWLFD